MIRTLVIDDEVKARETIIDMLNLFCKDIDVIGEASSVSTGIEMINHYNPDLILLDIRMTDGTGFDLLKKLDKIDFYVIFITAFEEYAIDAFKFSAINYLLKPIDPDELTESVSKVKDRLEKDDYSLHINTFFDNLESSNNKTKKLVLKTSDSIHIVSLNEIIRCQSDKNYTHFFTINNGKIIVSKTLKEYEEMLSDFDFFRAHQSHLINLNFIKRFDKVEGGVLVMKDNSKVPVSFRKREELMKFFKRL